MVSISVNSTSSTEARMVTVRSSMVSTLIAGGMSRVELRQLGLDLVDGVDDVGAGLLEYRQDDTVAVVLVSSDRAVDLFRRPPGRCRAPGSERRCGRPARRRCTSPASVIWSLAAIVKLILSVLIMPLAALVVDDDQRATDVLERQAARGELGGIDLDADRRRWSPHDGDLRDAVHLRDLLGEKDVGEFVDGDQRHGVGVQPIAAGSARPPD